jgi:hypothetical protein
MCSRRVLTVLLSVIVVAGLAALGTEASAGNCTRPPCASVRWYAGSCICCSTGSEIFDFTALGVPGWFVNNCPECQNCLKCSVFGTEQIVGGPTCAGPLSLDPNCGVEGVLFCVNHGGNASKAQGQPFTAAGVMAGDGNFSNCDRQGKCTGRIQVFGDLPTDVCQNPNWDAVSFTASKFNGQCCSCDIGYDENGNCPIGGTETCTEGFRCSVNPVPKPGSAKPYQCCSFSEIDPVTGECPQQ